MPRKITTGGGECQKNAKLYQVQTHHHNWKQGEKKLSLFADTKKESDSPELGSSQHCKRVQDLVKTELLENHDNTDPPEQFLRARLGPFHPHQVSLRDTHYMDDISLAKKVRGLLGLPKLNEKQHIHTLKDFFF